MPSPLPRRRLTSREIDLAGSVFGSTVDYSRVTIRKWGYFLGFQFSGTLVTPNGHIYAPPRGGMYSDDYSQERTEVRAVFIHEMTHVWQFQGGMNVKTRRLFGESNYDYNKADFGTKDFKTYGIEQEAHIVEDYYLRLFNRRIYDVDHGIFIDFDPPSLQKYRKVLSKYFPNV